MSETGRFATWLLVIAAWAASVGTVLAQGPANRRPTVLVLNSYYWGHTWLDGEIDGLLSVLNASEPRPEVFIENMDVLREPQPFDDRAFIDYLRERPWWQRIDLLITTDNAALELVNRYHHELFPGVPVVFTDAHHVDVDALRAELPITGVEEGVDVEATLGLVSRMFPDTKRIIVFGNKAETGAGPRLVQDAILAYFQDIEVELFEDLSIVEIRAVSATLGEDDLVFPLAFATGRGGAWYDYREVGPEIGRYSEAPALTFWYPLVEGAIGGHVHGPVEQGRRAGQLGLRILAGEDPNQIPVHNGVMGRYVFDYNELRKHGVPLSALPKQSVIEKRPTFFWQEYRKTTAAVLAAMAGLFGIILFLLRTIRQRRRAERELAAHKDQLERLVEERTEAYVSTNRSLSGTLERLEATQRHLIESEKMAALGGLVSGVAHEINTPLGVALTAASSLNDKTTDLRSAYEGEALAQDTFESFLEGAEATSGVILANLDQAVGLIRNFKHVAVDQTSEAERRIDLRSYLETTIQSLRPELKVGSHQVEIECPEGLELDTYPGAVAQILGNLVINTVRHGFGPDRTGGQIDVRATLRGGDVRMVYRDDGAGMTPEVLASAFEPFFTTARGQGGCGLGLHIVYNVVTHKLGGQISCESHPGRGVRFEIVFPANRVSRSARTPPAPTGRSRSSTGPASDGKGPPKLATGTG